MCTIDVTTVLLVDNHGRSSLGRFLNVKPELGLITSTARTFIQEGVTTEYATQVLGTTLDNGRLYAHLLTKSSRVLYDKDAPTRTYNDNNNNNKKWNVEKNLINKQNFVKNTDFVSPNKVDAYLVFPTTKPNPDDNIVAQALTVSTEEELLKSSPSNNPYQGEKPNNNIKVFKISPQMRSLPQDNFINNKENEINSKNIIKDNDDFLNPSKVRALDNLPTFTVRNEFSPSGYSFLGDLPNFDSNTERNKATTAAERKAKFLFRAGLMKPQPKDLKTVTYSGFADFTTTVGDTVIIFTPHTSEVPKVLAGHITKISVEPTIRPTASFKIQPTRKVIQPQKPTTESHKSTIIIDADDRKKRPKEEPKEEHEDMKAKSAVLAHEQQQQQPTTPLIETTTENEEDTTQFTSPEAIQPSETQIPMLSTPSDEDIAKIVASLQAQAAQQATQPLNTPATIFFDDPIVESSTNDQVLGGATTIFFEDEFPLQTSAVEEEQQVSSVTEVTTNPPTTIEMETTTEQEKEITTTTEKQKTTTTTTQKPTTITPTEETLTEEVTTPHIENVEEEEPQEEEVPTECTANTKVVPTTTYKTLTYLTTFFIPQDDSTTISIKSNEVVSSEIEYQTRLCNSIEPTSSTTKIEATTTIQPEEQEKEYAEQEENDDEEEEEEEEHERTTTEGQDDLAIDSMVQETTPVEITTEKRHVTESEPETTEMTTEDGDELELIFKTLYTTYTYLTTYFQDDTSSIASRIVVTTNVITSTIDPAASATDPAIAGLMSDTQYKSKPITFEEIEEIAPTSVGIGRPTDSIKVNAENGNTENALEAYPAQATPALNDEAILQTLNNVKTYYTTYTYFTTIFVDGETEIQSRTEVYTNYVTPSIQPDVSLENLIPTRIPSAGVLSQSDEDLFVSDQPIEDTDNDDDDAIKSSINNVNLAPTKSYNTTIKRQKTQNDFDNNAIVATPVNENEQMYVTLQRSTTPDDNLLDLSEYETISTMVTDVRSSTSEGDRRIIDNVDKRNVLLDDQIVSESNNDSEIIPSPTLLLQTSYTTFTYFTTIYHGTTSSDVVSRLETVTNVVTETLTPTQAPTIESSNLPVTYFTTFTYWTTLYKDGSTKVTSREETISNVVTPSAVATTDATVNPTEDSNNPVVSTPIEIEPSTSIAGIEPSSVVNSDNLTTYFTTYTYYTTSYIGNSTVLNSRLETVTNILNNSAEIDTDAPSPVQPLSVKSTEDNEIKTTSAPTAIESTSVLPTGLLSTVLSSEVNSGVTTLFSTDVFGTYIDGLYAKVLESTTLTLTGSIEPTKSSEQQNLKPTGVVSINQGSIVDADGVSTLYYTTKAIGTYIDNLYAQVIESTSSLNIDTDKQSSLATETPTVHKTGLVRLIEGSVVQNDTTTLYQSKVLGTVIDGRYAQIIESTSSFIVGKPSSSAGAITPTATQAISATDIPISPSPVAIEGSLTDSTKTEEENTTEENEGDEEEEGEDEEGEDGDNGRTKSRLTFQTRKRTFTPVIRPFVSRPRPTFAPSRKKGGPASATTITRSDFTPTVTAVPASKPSRFGGRRSSASSAISPTASGSRRFSRPKSSSTSAGASSSFGRGRSSSRIQPTTSRRGNFRTSATSAPAVSRSSSSRYRVRPTLASSLNRFPSSNAVTQPSVGGNDENDLTTQVTDNPTEAIDEETDTTAALSPTTEGSSRRSQNPLLRFRRPPLARPTPPARSTTRNGKSTAKNGNRATTTTTTAKPKSAYRSPNLQNRARPNALFPRRNIFTTTTTSTPPPEEEEELQEEDEVEEEGGEEGADTDYEGSETDSQTENPVESSTQAQRRGLSLNPVQIRPFAGLKRRSKRQTTYSRFRRPGYRSSSTTAAPKSEEVETEATTKTTTRGRFSRNRNKQQSTTTTTTTSPPPKRISPSKASVQGRSQFTLREKGGNARSNFKRPSSGSYRTTTASTPTRPKAPRLRNSQTEAPSSRKSSTKSNGRSRGSSRQSSRQSTQRQQHSREQLDNNYVLPDFDGTITVTHTIPTEISIPVVNGKVTEYKNVVTAKYSTEVLGPRQYSTTLNPFGKEVTVLLSESTDVGSNGETKVTQYTLNETPTTSVIFTPTYIRGRKTSFSHVIPSTAYGVEQVVTTIQPALAAQAPLANILLSQLLLGGLQPQNPLLGLQNPAAPPTPTTEYKTRTTTYVTTVTSLTSTVLPLTFRGKEILTTIVDSSTNVVTATEFLTDTIVVTPTVNPNQLNSLLVPLLLQQQQQQQIIPPSNPLLPQSPAGVYNLGGGLEQTPLLDLHHENYNLADGEEPEEFSEDQVITEEVTRTPKRKGRKKPKRPEPVEPSKETSVITLYVSGKTPNEFSTVLSTVIVGEEGNKKKREVSYIPVTPSKAVAVSSTTLDYLDTYLAPISQDVVSLDELESSLATESLESIIGDVSKHYTTKPIKASKKYKYIKASDSGLQKQSSGNFLVL